MHIQNHTLAYQENYQKSIDLLQKHTDEYTCDSRYQLLLETLKKQIVPNFTVRAALNLARNCQPKIRLPGEWDYLRAVRLHGIYCRDSGNTEY